MKNTFFLLLLLLPVIDAVGQHTIQKTLYIKSNGVNSTEILLYKEDTTSYYDLFANNSGFGINNSTTSSYPFYINSLDNIGLGTINPEQKLDVHGNIIVRGGLISTFSNPDIGGRLELRNPAKMANGTASSWQIFNMSGGYGNSLQFWAYDDVGCSLPNGLCSNRFTIMDNGNVGIGTIPNSKLAVNGNIRAREIKVEASNWPDFVFAENYKLSTLEETEKHINEKGHLPGIPSALAVKANGIELGEMNAKLLQKIEELTLHLIEMKKENSEMKRSVQQQNIALEKLSNKIKNLK